MRWRLWPFRPGTPASTPAPAEGARAADRDWASLPSIQRSVGTTTLTAQSVTFVRGLTGRVPPDLALARLGHVRSPEAPAGLLVARALTPPTPPPAPTLLELLRLRSHAPQAVVNSGPGEVDVAVEPERAPDITTGLEPASPGPSPELPVALRLAEVVPVQNRPAPVPTSLTQAPVHLEPPVAQLLPPDPVVVEEPPAVAPSEPAPAAPRLNLGQSRRLGLGPRPAPELPLAQRSVEVPVVTGGEPASDPVPSELPVAPAPAEAPPPSGAAESTVQRAPEERFAAPFDDQAPAGGSVVSATTPPLPSPPAGAAPQVGPSPMPHVQRSESTPQAAPASPGRVTAPILRVRRRVPAGDSEPARLITIQATGERVEAGLTLGAAPEVSGDATPDPSPSAGSGPEPPLVLGATANEDPPAPAVAGTPPAPEVSPTVGGPTPPGGSAAEVRTAPAPMEAAGPPAPLVFRATALPPIPEAPPEVGRGHDGEPAQAGTPPPGTLEPTVARTVVSDPVDVILPVGAAGEPVRDLTGSRPSLPLSAAGLRPSLGIRSPALERHDGGPPPAVAMPAPRPPQSMAVQALGAPVSPEAPSSVATPPMPLIRAALPPAPAPVVQPFPGLGPAPLAAVANQVDTARSAAESELGQASSELGRAASAGQAAEARASQGVAAEQAVHQASGGAAGMPSSDKDVEELAGRLYDRIRSRLRSELLIGRERAGRMTDLR